MSDRDGSPSRGLLLVGHGTRHAAGRAEFEALAARIAARLPHRRVAHGFLELASPTLGEAMEVLARAGVSQVEVVPVLLLSAGHAQRDIPQATAAAAARCGLTVARQTDVLRFQPRLLELSRLRFLQAVAGSDAADAETLLVFAGRGSSDPGANADLERVARRRFEDHSLGGLRVCYLSRAVPGLEETLAAAQALPFRQVVIQPHLLFQGELLERVRQGVFQQGSLDPRRRWLLTEPLGPDELLVEAVLELIEPPGGPL